MEINWLILFAVLIVVIVLIYILIKQNKKDKEELEKELKYFKKPDEIEPNDEDSL